MGCWEETCGLTNTPIFAGQECFMVVLNPEYINDTRDIERSAIGLMGSGQWKVVHSIHHGKYNDYGWIDGVPEANNGIGEYPQRLPSIFFHKAAWDYAQSRKEPIDDHIFQDPLEVLLRGKTKLKISKYLREFAHVCFLAAWYRRDIFSGLKYRGHQEWSVGIKERKEFIDLQMAILKSQKEYLSDEDDVHKAAQ